MTTTRPKPLRRRPEEAKLAGVCAGLADYFDIDVGLVRAATAALILLGPTVVAFYVILWVVLDEAEPAPAIGEPAHTPGLIEAPVDDVIVQPSAAEPAGSQPVDEAAPIQPLDDDAGAAPPGADRAP